MITVITWVSNDTGEQFQDYTPVTYAVARLTELAKVGRISSVITLMACEDMARTGP